MKKTRLLALVLIVAMALTGAGYALWSETLTVNSTIRTGVLDFIFTDVKVWGQSKNMEGKVDTNLNVNNGERNNDDSGIGFEFTDMFPGSTSTISFFIKNNGTMDGYLDNFELTETDYDKFIRVTKLQVGGTIIDQEFPINELDEKLQDLGIEISANPEYNRVYFEIGFKIADCLDGENIPEELGKADWNKPNEALVYNLTAKGKQWNDEGQCDPKDPKPDPDPTKITGVTITQSKDNKKKFTANVEPSQAADSVTYKWRYRTKEKKSDDWGEWRNDGTEKSFTYTGTRRYIKVEVTVNASGDYTGEIIKEQEYTFNY